MAGPWEKYGGAPQAPQAGPMVVGTQRPKPPAAPPSVYEQGQDAIANRNTDFDNTANLRKEFNALQPVKDYGAALGALGSMWKAPDNAQGDLAVVYGFAKVMDPGSVVREGEMDMANSTSSVVQDIYRQYGKISDGNRLPPEVRKQLITTAAKKGRALNEAYSQERSRYRSIAEQRGFSPDEILGDHLGDAFQSAEQQFRGGMVSNEDLRAQLQQRVAAGEDPSRTIMWLQEQGQPLDEQTINAIIANRGNQNPDIRHKSDTQVALEAGVGDLAEGTGDLLGLVGNPLNAGINAVAGTNLSTDLGQTFRDATGLPQGNPMASAINQGGIAALGGAGLARGAQALAPEIARYAAPISAEPIRQGAAGAGAGAGTEIARQNNMGPVGEIAGGLAGGLGAYGGANALMRLAQPRQASPLMQAATDQGVRLRPADVGGANVKRMDSAAAQSAFSAGSISNAAKQTQDDMGAALNRSARSQGDVLPEDEAGEALIGPLKGYSQKQAQRIGRVYDRAESRAQGVKIKPQQSLAFLDEQIARFRQAPQGESIAKELQSVRDSIANGVSVAGMRDARTILSQGVYDGKLRSGQQKGLYKQLLKSMASDIEIGLSAAGRKDALNLFKIADKAWSERIEYVDNVLEPVIGRNKSGEQVLAAIEGMARGKGGGIRRLNEVLRELPPEQAGNVRATVIDRMGRATPGNQSAAGDEFSANTFLTNWNKMSAKGKVAMFGDSELRKNLDQIARLAEATAETGRFANFSNTGGALNNNLVALGTATGVSEIATGYGLATFGALAGAQLLTGKLLASPRFAAWLAKAPKNPQAMQRHEGQLAQIAAREPIIANDIASIQQYLGSAAQRAAAGSEDQPE